MKMAAFGGNTKFRGHDPIIYRRLQEQEIFLPSPLTVQTPTMPDQQTWDKALTGKLQLQVMPVFVQSVSSAY